MKKFKSLSHTVRNYQYEYCSIRANLNKAILIIALIFIGHNEEVLAFHSWQEQSTTITGTVTDPEGLPLPGVNVIEKGTTNGTQTDFNGNYSIEVSSGNAILVFSFVGMTAVEKEVQQNTIIDVEMEPDQQSLEEVVIVGYGVQKNLP